MLWSWHIASSLFALILFLAHSVVALWVLPLVLGIGLMVVTLLVALYPMYCMGKWVLLGTSLVASIAVLFLAILLYYRLKTAVYGKKLGYLKEQKKQKEAQKIKQTVYRLLIDPSHVGSNLEEEDGVILEKVVADVAQSISFLDDSPLYRQDFERIIHRFSDWAMFLKKSSKSKAHMLLLPREVSLDKLINQLEVLLESEVGPVPRLLITQEGAIPGKIVCDVSQILYVLVTAVLYIADRFKGQYVTIALQPTQLSYDRSGSIQNVYDSAMVFPAIALVVGNVATAPSPLSKVQSCYEPLRDYNKMQGQPADLSIKTIERIVNAHYGYLGLPLSNQAPMRLVLPCNVATVRDKMIAQLPMEVLTSEASIPPKEKSDSIMVLMAFHDYICSVSGVESGVISEILLLLRRCYGFKRHRSGQLFYVRAVGIAQLVSEWVPDSAKLMYASLLYALVGYSRLPLSYIKANYHLDIFAFVEKVLEIDRYKDIGLFVGGIANRLKGKVGQDCLLILYLKFAERLYDLGCAKDYRDQAEVKWMAGETLRVDIGVAKQYLEPKIATALERVAKRVLEV